jgi:hypothetical protein
VESCGATVAAARTGKTPAPQVILGQPQYTLSIELSHRQQEVAKAMRTDPLPYEVRELVIRTLEYFDVFLENPLDLDETILIDDGRYSARTYEADGHMAMWLLDIGIVQFYDPDGNMLRTVNLFEELEPQRMAA